MAPSTTTVSAPQLVVGLLLALTTVAAVSTAESAPAVNTSCVTGSAGAAVSIGYGGARASAGAGMSLGAGVYRATCPRAEEIVRAAVQRAVAADPRMAASLLRLHFHDCFVNGCDGSVLLDDKPPFFVGEKTAVPNANSLRGFEVIDAIKAELERECPETVSCSDLLAIAARDSVVVSGGPSWEVEVGRKDSRTASLQGANTNLPAPTSGVTTLVQKFRNVGLSAKDMVALSGAHTIGKARCTSFSARLSGVGVSTGGAVGASKDLTFLQSLQQLCSGSAGSALAHLDLATPATFDNQYYINLLSGDGLLPSDQELASPGAGAVPGADDDVSSLVALYAFDASVFFEDFAESMLRMGRLAPGGGSSDGEVRMNCRVVNSST
ncbi:Peroxidase 40 [Dichanthelium oligosanthes]|uniref:Peroxidase n=1 Tax=Dichanthelium oligosanthes TaxID=888268 RepID=A0A1E5V343_9POAL|nr:Peroxidase 40 [Dichanthelium oligosanthes]